MKKHYIQPRVENTQLSMSSIVMAGSPGINWSGEPLGASDEGD